MKKPVIICVDDQPTILDSLKIELKATLGEDYAIETAEGGEDALDLLIELLEDGCEIPLVISDYLMPDMKGDELLRQVHQISSKTIKIMLTGQADVKAVGNAIKYAKLYRYIAKPWQQEDLKLTVKEAINSYLLEKELAEKNVKLQQLNEELEALVDRRTAQLRQEQEKFAKAFQSTPHAITITRLRDGRHIEVNDAFCEMTGYAADEIIGRTAVDLNIWVNLSDRKRLFELLASQGFVRNYEFESRTKSGEIRTALLSSEMIEIGGENCLISVSQDITERKRSSEELRKSEERWQLVLKANNDAIWDANLVTGEVFRSRRWKEMLGYEESEIGNSVDEWKSRIHPEDLNRVTAAMKQHLDGITPFYTAEYRLRCKDDSYKWIQDRGQAVWDESGKPVRLLGSQSDINYRKQAELNLAESEQKYRSLVETSQDVIWACDRTGRINFINQASKQVYGYEPSQMLGRYFSDFLAPEAVAASNEWHQRLLNGESIFQAESTIITQDGREVNILTNAIAVKDPEGNIIGTTGTASDITTRKQAEIALKQAKEAADKANRAKSEFLANMSHELRTPLNAILGFTQLLSRDPSLHTEQKEQINIITKSGEHLLNLINSILQMSKIEVGRVSLEPNPFDLHHLIETIEDMLQLQAQKKGLQLIFDQDPNLPRYLKTDESKLRQVLLNLLGNAIKFTKEGGVTLRVKSEQSSTGVSPVGDLENVSITNYQLPITHCRLYFEIEDTGPGIAEAEMDNLFKPFAQTETGRRSQEGTGLGLPISRQFIQLMHGDITVNSKVGEGTIFKFDIAVDLATSSEIQATQETKRVISLEPNQPEYRILVVDDRMESRLFLVKMLTSIGFSVCEAENGLQAVDIWSMWEPHLILMDMRMPVMDGYEATKRIKTHLKGQATVIIALTASAFDEERSVILSAGCDDFVAKPFREQVILDKMTQYLGVRYVYEQQHSSTPSNGELPSTTPAGNTHSSFVLQPESFQLMPPEWVKELYDAACSIDNELIFCLIEQIPSESAPLKHAIADLVNNFRCDQIIDLIDVFQSQ
ncbi:PAS domain S-box protein [Microseira wollei]|uniref:Circadian input-output histidine kinase CikA n=1 Tax=Microseira wollei NIES-4236 TaxID=2530354 RepID=A0AAV3XEX6_9CYAN|nr:PAS domain S-box protein [Microseira wollei]GET41123.1 multi-sensor hybrid histidine kinase [Microseira wollei NIES-4236]